MLLAFEGCEGCGKTTQANLTKSWLELLNYKVLLTKEPGGEEELNSQIQKILLNPTIEIDPLTELFLYSADRVNHINKIINPSIQKYDVIICDRFFLSTLAYQCYGRGIKEEIVEKIISYSLNNLDITTYHFWIDADIEKSLKLKKEKDRIEQENLRFHKNVHNGYKKIAKDYPDVIKSIKGNKYIVEVQKEIREVLYPLLN